jgi:hypothetical protein
MAILSRTITALLFLAWPLWAAPAFAASSTPAAPQKARQTADAKGYAFIDSHEEILAKAKKEGKLRVQSSLDPHTYRPLRSSPATRLLRSSRTNTTRS